MPPKKRRHPKNSEPGDYIANQAGSRYAARMESTGQLLAEVAELDSAKSRLNRIDSLNALHRRVETLVGQVTRRGQGPSAMEAKVIFVDLLEHLERMRTVERSE